MSTKVVTSLKLHPSDLGQLHITSEDILQGRFTAFSALFYVWIINKTSLFLHLARHEIKYIIDNVRKDTMPGEQTERYADLLVSKC